MEINYVGENLFPGNLGYFFVALSFVAALVSLLSYGKLSFSPSNTSWRTIGRWAFAVHSVALVGVISTLFYLIYNHEFQYLYVWQHSSTELPVHFMISCFWEGQEGSFLLWAFWNIVIGGILIKSSGKWEGPVMSVLGCAQVILASMLLGIEALGMNFGSNPFVLLRNAFPEEEIFQLANYVPLIDDGSGLNPLLQNYWMVIHPPVIFVGYAAMLVPFAYAIGGLWFKEYKEWIAPALPWALFSVMSLGTGILMGGAWAYETLNFGGFWAWDPVENASLVPWLLMIAAVHTMLIFKRAGNAVVTTFVLVWLSFVAVIYASYLTRSGVLGEASVHSFTDLGLSGQLVFFLLLFLVMGAFFLIWRRKELPISQKEEDLYSREFWMFIGALILSIASFQIIFSTSIPVINQIPNLNMAPPADPIEHYNRFQLPFAVLVGLLAGSGQYFRYRKTPKKNLFKKLGISLAISLVLTVGLVFLTQLYNLVYNLLLFSFVYAVVANIDIMIPMILKGKIKNSGAAISHIGFGLLLFGALISKSQQETVSINHLGVDFGENFEEEEQMTNLMLVKDRPTQMMGYEVTYRGKFSEGMNEYFEVDYVRKDSETGEVEEEFTLYPYSQVDDNMGLVSSPDTRHYLLSDLYTHASSIPDEESGDLDPEYNNSPDTLMVEEGDVIHRDPYKVTIEQLRPVEEHDKVNVDDFDVMVALDITLDRPDRDRDYHASPMWGLQGTEAYRYEDELEEHAFKFELLSIDPEKERFELKMHEGEVIPDYMVMKAIVFPYINFLWLGIIVLVIGFTTAMVQRIREYKRISWKEAR